MEIWADQKKEFMGNDEKNKPTIPVELHEVIKAGVKANREVSGSVAVGGSVCALFAQHRLSIDIDFVLTDLNQRFQEVRDHLFEIAGWQEARFRVPVLILGSLDGIAVGYRQLRRAMPLETQEIQTPEGVLIVPTLEELLRIKAFLAYERDYTRDFVDFAELSCLLPDEEVVNILNGLDERFRWEKQPSMIMEVTKALLRCEPHDNATHGFSTLRLLHPKFDSWEQVRVRCQELGDRLLIKLLGED